jgi:hypothetical protein
MKLSQNIAMPLLGIYLVASGLWPLVGAHVPAGRAILAVLALAAGVSILAGSTRRTPL